MSRLLVPTLDLQVILKGILSVDSEKRDYFIVKLTSKRRTTDRVDFTLR
jgi:hypothetical protein